MGTEDGTTSLGFGASEAKRYPPSTPTGFCCSGAGVVLLAAMNALGRLSAAEPPGFGNFAISSGVSGFKAVPLRGAGTDLTAAGLLASPFTTLLAASPPFLIALVISLLTRSPNQLFVLSR